MGIGRIETTKIGEYISLSWANGIVKVRSNEKARFQDHVGWFTAVGQNNDFDKAMEAAGFHIIEIQHSDAIKKHWNIGEELHFLPITMGTPSTSVFALMRASEKAAEAGVGVRWPKDDSSKVGIVGYIKELADNGVYIAVKVGAHSRMCEYLLRAIADHSRCCQFADSIIDRSKHPDPVELYEIVLTLTSGDQTVFGKGNATSLVVPIISGHPQELTKDHIIQHYITSEEIKSKAIAEFTNIQQWAKSFNASSQVDEGSSEPENNGNGTHTSNGNGSGAQKPAQQATNGNDKEEVTLIGIVTDQKVNDKRTWMGFKLFTEDEQEQFCTIFFKGVVQKALETIEEGDSILVTGYYEDDKLVVKRFEPYDAAKLSAVEQADEIPF